MCAEEAKAVYNKSQPRQILLCEIGSETFGIEIGHVQEVVEPGPMQRIPKAPEFAVGLLSYHGGVIAVVDMAKFFNIESVGNNKSPMLRVVVMEKDGYNLGLMVDKAEQIVSVEGTGKGAAGSGLQYVQELINVNGCAVNLLDIEKFLIEIEQYFD